VGESVGLILAAFGGRVAVVDTSGFGVATELASWYPPQFVASPTAPTSIADASIVIREEPEGTLRAEREGGPALVESCAPARLAAALLPHLELDLARSAEGYVFVHAGVVAWRGSAIVVPGAQGTGKSSLVAELVRSGATYYSDEWAVLGPSGLVHAFPRPSFVGGQPTTGAAPLPPIPVACVVATAYAAGAEWTPSVLRGAHALLPVLDNAVVLREQPGPVLAAVGALGTEVVTFESLRPDAPEVALAILELASAVLDDRLDRYASVQRAGRFEPRVSSPVVPDGANESRQGDDFHRAPFLRFEDFLTAEEHARLLEYVFEHEDDLADSTVVPGGAYGGDGPVLDGTVRRSRTLDALDPAILEIFEPRIRALLPMARRELGVPWFRLDRLEHQLHAHGGGDFFTRHVDNGAPSAATRKVSAVYYFHRSPARFRGGALYLYDEFGGAGARQIGPSATVITPVDNTLVVFASNSSHEVEPVRLLDDDFGSSRFTITLWCREEEPPVADTDSGTAAPLTR